MRIRKSYQSGLLAVFMNLGLVATAWATIYTVNSAGDTPVGTCDTGGGCTLREAVVAANNNAGPDTIVFDAAVFSSPKTISLTRGQLTIENNGALTINGPGVDLLSVSGSNLSRVFYVDNSATASISDLTVTAARSNGPNGGGIVASNSSSVSLTRLRISGNFAPSGGGVLALPGSVVSLSNSTVTNNDTFRAGGSLGGGLYNSQGIVNIDNSIVTGNNAGYGGGIYNGGGTMTVSNSTVSGNTANDGGGVSNGARFPGAVATDGVLTLNNTTISLNVVTSRGGGFVNFLRNTATLNNSTISANTAFSGGGVWNTGDVVLNSLTISGNSATVGGGIRQFDETGQLPSPPLPTTSVNSTIVANSTNGGDCAASSRGLVNVAYSLIEEGLACVSGINVNNLTGDPNLGPLQNNGGPTATHALLPGSIAIDTGNSSLSTDQRGSPRPFDSSLYANLGNGSDIGAFEYQGLTPTDKDQCKLNGYMYFDRPAFRNQGQCIQFVNTGK